MAYPNPAEFFHGQLAKQLFSNDYLPHLRALFEAGSAAGAPASTEHRKALELLILACPHLLEDGAGYSELQVRWWEARHQEALGSGDARMAEICQRKIEDICPQQGAGPTRPREISEAASK